MSRPQFTLRNMLIAVAYLAAAISCFRAALLPPDEWDAALALLGFKLFGGAIGAIFNRQFLGAAIGLTVVYASVYAAFVAVLILSWLLLAA